MATVNVACPRGQRSFYSFLIAEIAEFAEVEWGKGMRVINCLNGALVFAFRQIPSPYCMQSSSVCQHVIVTTCWETHPLSHLELSKWWSENPSPSAGSHLQISPDVGMLKRVQDRVIHIVMP